MDIPGDKLAPEYVHRSTIHSRISMCSTVLADGIPSSPHQKDVTCPRCGPGYPKPCTVKRPNGRPLTQLMVEAIAYAAMDRRKQAEAGLKVGISAPLVEAGYFTPGDYHRITREGHRALAQAFPDAPLGITPDSIRDAVIRYLGSREAPDHLSIIPEQVTRSWLSPRGKFYDVPGIWEFRWACLNGECATSTDRYESIWAAYRDARQHTENPIACMYARTRAEQERR